jgi:pimeloyl-ACP methyl ester carboxylesterase
MVRVPSPPSPALSGAARRRAPHEERFLGLAESIAAEEGVTQISALSWCSGSKYSLALAAAAPALVESLVLLTPSFVGATPDEEDSGFEKSLLTMCKVVSGQPGSAPGMARSMLALLEKGAGASPPPWLGHVKKPFTAGPCMIDYAEQLLHFRAHDVTGRLGGVTQPLLLVTASKDETTSAARAKRLCADLPAAAGG